MSDEREKLIRECFDLENDFHYWGYRQEHWDSPEIVSHKPDPEAREKMMRGYWNFVVEEEFPAHRAEFSTLSMEELKAVKEEWIDRLSLLGEKEYKDILAEAASRMPSNDNQKGRER